MLGLERMMGYKMWSAYGSKPYALLVVCYTLGILHRLVFYTPRHMLGFQILENMMGHRLKSLTLIESHTLVPEPQPRS